MFAYCLNDPVSNEDQNGYLPGDGINRNRNLAIARDVEGGIGGGVGGLFLGGMLIIAAGATAYSVVKVGEYIWEGATQLIDWISDAFSRTSIEEQLSNTAKRYGNFQCKEALEAMKKVLQKQKKKYDIVELYFTGRAEVRSVSRGDMVISLNGDHVGILYNGMVYCNVHPFGLPQIQWELDFIGVGMEEVKINGQIVREYRGDR